MNENLLTEEQLKQKAIEYDKMLTRGLYENLLLLKGINDEKLYRYLGFESLEDYCKDRWDMAKQTMYHYLSVANTFLPEHAGVSPTRLFELGIEKMKILKLLEPAKREKLAVEGIVELCGTSYTIDDLKPINTKILSELVTGKKEETTQEQTDIPWVKVYIKTGKYFNKIIADLKRCSEMNIADRQQIRIALGQAMQVFEIYRKQEPD